MKFKKMMPTKKQIVILLLFLFGFCTIPLPAFCDSGAVGKQSIGELRQRQQEDLDRLKSYYDDLARKHVPKLKNGEVDTGSSEYKSLEKEYLQAHKKLREAYLKKDPRLSDFQAGNEISGIKSTGSKPRDVRADVDWTAETPEAMEAKRRQWEQRGDVVVDKGHKIVNQTTDETLWKPGSEPGSDGLVHDGDAHGTQGGREAVTRKKSAEGHDISGDGIRDAEGAALDHEKKYLDAKERNNLKDQAKTAVKSADDTGRTNDVIDQARELKNYGDEITSKISHLGEDPNQRADKVKEFQEKLDAEMDASMAEGRRKGQQTDQLRKKIADSARKAENTGDAAWDEARKNSNYDNQNTTSEAVENHRNAVAESNKKTKDEIARRKSETDPVRPDTDTPDAAKKTHINDKTDKKRVSPPDPPALIKKKLSETNRQDSAANKQADDNPARSLDNAGSKEAAGSSPGRSKAGQVADGFNTADDAIQIIEMGTTIVEGIQQEDAAKTVSPVVGQDTAKRVKMEKAQKWADLEGKAEEIKKTEVSSELEAKLRRMGASKDEARDARNKWDKGDVKGFRDDVAKIKSRGRKDTAPRGLSPDSAIEEEDGVLDRLKEGGKQAGRYVDGFYGGINERTQKSVENRNELNSVQENIQGGIQDEIDNELIKKMMQKGVPYKKARDALNKKRSGDSRAWNNLRDNLPGRDNPSAKHDGKGLSADGKTQSYETGNLTEDWKDNALKEAEQKGKTILKPIDMIAEWQEANHLEEMRDNERAAEFYKAMRKWGASKEEALEAARTFAETGDRSKSGKIYQKYLKENLEKREQEKRPNEHKDLSGKWACNTGYHRVNGKCVPEPEPECRSDAQCQLGLVCKNGRCVSPFDSGYDDYEKTISQKTSDRDQDQADRIAADQIPAGKPKPGYSSEDLTRDLDTAQNDMYGRCNNDSQCPPGYVCSNGSCVDPFQNSQPADPGADPDTPWHGDPAGDPMNLPDPAANLGNPPAADPADPVSSSPPAASLVLDTSVIDQTADSIQYSVAASVTGVTSPISLRLSVQNAGTGGSIKTMNTDGTVTWAVTVLDKNATATVRRSDTGASQTITLAGRKPAAQPPAAPVPQDPQTQAPGDNYDGTYTGWVKYVCARNGVEYLRGTDEGIIVHVRGNKISGDRINGTISGTDKECGIFGRKISGKDIDSGFSFSGDINYKRAYGFVSNKNNNCRGTFEFTRQ